ncbi:MAG: DUF4105 domain-containing protein [Pseudomonadota bacterium]
MPARFFLSRIFSRSIIGHIVFAVSFLLWITWSATAQSFHLQDAALLAGWMGLGVAGSLVLAARARSPQKGWMALSGAIVLTIVCYQTIQPEQNRDWASDVSRGVKADTQGDIVRLADVRDFQWHDADTATPRWTTHRYDLAELETVDMITSVWDSPDIAHLLVSFGFSDARRVVFSVEIRKEAQESFDALGGFFRQFELVLIAATEDDIVKLRTNHRNEDVRLYPLALSAEQRRDLFLAYVALAQQLENEPMFYNTLTANCTTTVFGLARQVLPHLRPDWRIVMSGHLPSYADANNGFDGAMPLEDRIAAAAVTQKARTYKGANFSDAIRDR